MTYPVTGVEGSVVSWGAAGFYATLLSRLVPNVASMQIVTDEIPRTGLNATTAALLTGLRSVSGRISAYNFASPKLGNVGSVAWTSGGYQTHVERWSLTVETTNVHDWTSLSGSPTWRAFRPDNVRWYGSYVTKVDNATDLVLTDAAGASSVNLTLIYGSTSSGDRFTGTAFATRLDTGFRVGDINRAEYRFHGTGDLTPADSTSPFGATAFGVPLWTGSSGSLSTTNTLLTLASNSGGQTYTVDAFYRSMTITCDVGQSVSLDIDFQGTGAVAGNGIG